MLNSKSYTPSRDDPCIRAWIRRLRKNFYYGNLKKGRYSFPETDTWLSIESEGQWFSFRDVLLGCIVSQSMRQLFPFKYISSIGRIIMTGWYEQIALAPHADTNGLLLRVTNMYSSVDGVFVYSRLEILSTKSPHFVERELEDERQLMCMFLS